MNKKINRAKKLIRLGEILAVGYKNEFKDRKLAVVVERKVNGNKFVGKTEFYFDIEFAGRKFISPTKIKI